MPESDVYENIHFNHIDGVTAAIDRSIKQNFPGGLAEVAKADKRQLQDIRGVNLVKAADIINFAKEKLEKKKGKKTKIVGKADDSVSDRELIIVEVRIDEKTTKRSRIPLTPAVCRECGFDLISMNGLKPWDELDEVTRERIKQDMEVHMNEYHSVTERKIVRESEIKKQSWLRPNG